MEERKEIGAECRMIHASANQAIKHINNQIETLREQREYQKGLRDAAYTILNMVELKE